MLQVVSFNLGGAKKIDTPIDPAQVGRAATYNLLPYVDPSRPLLVGLQEITQVRWAVPDDDAPLHQTHTVMAKLLGDGFRADFRPTLTTTYNPHTGLWDRPYYATHPAGLAYAAEGNGLLGNLAPVPWPWGYHSRYPYPQLAAASLLPLHTQISHAALYSTGNRDTEPRQLLVASLAHPTYGPLYFMNTHIGTIRGENRHDTSDSRTRAGEAIRRRQVAEILRVVDEIRAAEAANNAPPRPIILVGDFNATPTSTPMQDLQARFRLVPPRTPPSQCWSHKRHKLLIDHVLVQDPTNVLPAAQLDVITDIENEALTDHRPVLATFAPA